MENPDPDTVADPECMSMRSGKHDAVEEELESCFLEVSLELSNLNATENKTEIQKMGSHLDTSICSRSFNTQRSTNAMRNNSIIAVNGSGCSTLPKPINERSIDNLIEWNCSAAIIKAYKKKGILEMFEWQVECLNRPKVTIFLQISVQLYGGMLSKLLILYFYR